MSSSNSPVHIIAIISPKPGKAARVEELLRGMIKDTWDKEKDFATRYHMHRQLGATDGEDPEIIMTETYTSHDTSNTHLTTPHFQAFAKKMQEESLLKSAPKIVQCESVAGFESREGGLFGL